MRDNDQKILEEAYTKVLTNAGYPKDWDKGFQKPFTIAAGGTEEPFLKNGKWYLNIYNQEEMKNYIYSYYDDMFYPEYYFDLPDRADLNLEKACWKNYEQIGMKKKGGKMVPNCVPKKKKRKKA
jgi:hypothetical protein